MKLFIIGSAGVVGAGLMLFTIAGHQRADAHCQVPCGIYDDAARISAMMEDTATITKAMKQINELSDKHDALNINQSMRWINTKEHHASHIITTVSEYFLTQKVKVVESGADGYQAYLENLADHHHVLKAAMKTKQTVDPANAVALQTSILKLGARYGKRQGS